jgi:hypothetical protein
MDESHFSLEILSLPPLWVLFDASLGPLFTLEIGGSKEAAKREK